MKYRPTSSLAQLDMFDETLPLRRSTHTSELPVLAQRLVDLIGMDATINLVKEEGGNELHLPAVVDGRSVAWARLAEIVGHDAAAKLVRDWPDIRLYVPMCTAALKAERNREIVRRYSEGEPFDSIRRRFKVSRAHLFRLLKKPV